MADVKETGLVSLDEGDWDVAEGEPDVRGWDVVTSDRRKIGEVGDLLADAAAMKVRYLAIELDANTAAASERTIRVPISRARIHESDRQVVLDMAAIPQDDIAAAPAQAWSQDQVRVTRSAEELRVGKREKAAGEVEVKKDVETEKVRQPVTLRREEIDIERRPVSGTAAAGEVEITAQEIRVPVVEEEVVVEKRPVVKEEVIISKRAIEEQQTVEADVRTERIDVERHGDVRANDRDRDRSR